MKYNDSEFVYLPVWPGACLQLKRIANICLTFSIYPLAWIVNNSFNDISFIL